MGFFSNAWNSVKKGLGQVAAVARQGIGKATPWIHKIASVANSGAGKAILGWVPFGNYIKKGIGAVDSAATAFDETDGFRKAPSLEGANNIAKSVKNAIF